MAVFNYNCFFQHAYAGEVGRAAEVENTLRIQVLRPFNPYW